MTRLSFSLTKPWQHLTLVQNYPALVTVVLTVVLVLTIGLSLTQGSVSLTGTEVWQAILRSGSPMQQTIIWELRLPRIIAGVLVGASLGMSGALLQGMLRNSLADAYILGISAGAGLVAIVLITLGLFLTWVPLAAWLGAILVSLLVYTLARTSVGISIERLILGGVAFSFLLFSIQTVFLLFAEEGRVQAALIWLTGSLNGRGWSEVKMSFPYIAIALLLGSTLGKTMNVLSLGDDLAVGLGISLGRSRIWIGAIATLLAASAVSIAGLVGFVGLVVPHGVRLLVGADYRWVLPLSAIAGAWVLTLSDLLARLGAIELPVGAVTSLLGCPLFIVLLYRRSKLAKGF
ncbi:FecCD family ABC transporter permease [Myxacorys almedinensis]|uniref:Iron chelate uptake ABC transporter family permease subunit n=1 Tax=Myxacorys almedinensis A TaxID=2690445 RepID=A0A8J7ZC20_9CYAN|nr:iron ABC transporter permease [Myxacorys almedinensis]NDJ19200.1 iron chelate uptake ABC transporter family permease subunit [Myxacorys almedinensis A]